MAFGTEWSPSQRIEADYRAQILNLVSEYLDLPEMASLGQIVSALSDWMRFQNFLQQSAESIAARMVTHTMASNARSWREAARKGGRGREIYEALKHEMEGDVGDRVRQLVRENASLISSIPEEIRASVNEEISELEQGGYRAEAIAGYLQNKIPHLVKSKANLIARTETSKSAMALTQARAEDLDLPWYEWQTSRDQRVRESHRNLQGVLVRWDDPPNPESLIGVRSTLGRYNAGGAPNCRCDGYPMLRLSNVQWPHKVYANGRIRMMTKNGFAKKFLAGTGAQVYA
jgi:SPP1 gp7 family putative phage head morphogenesis protein